MRRVIEELIEKRKTRQEELKASLDELAAAIETPGFLKKKRPEIQRQAAAAPDVSGRLHHRPGQGMGRLRQQPFHHGLQVAAMEDRKARGRIFQPQDPAGPFRRSWKTSWTACWTRWTTSLPRKPPPNCAPSRSSCRPCSMPISNSASAATASRSRRGCKNTCRFSPADSEMLDIGCGRGEFLALLRPAAAGRWASTCPTPCWRSARKRPGMP